MSSAPLSDVMNSSKLTQLSGWVQCDLFSLGDLH